MNQETWLKRARALAWVTIGFNVLEGVISIAFGMKEESVSLWGFGLDSLVEVASATIVLWRLQGHCTTLATKKERHATMLIGGLFLLLACSVIFGAVHSLREGEHPATTLPGVWIAIASMSIMGYLWHAKRTVGKAMNSAALLADAACSLACIQLSVVLLMGSAAFHINPNLWWVDAAAALILSCLIAREGIGGIRAARNPTFSGGCGCH